MDPASRRPVARVVTIPAYLIASGVLTISVVGDSLFYAIIPAAAHHYGLGAVGISVVLSINRFIRILLNPLIAAWLAQRALRAGAVLGAVLAIVSTTAYALAPGLIVLAVSRAAWGIAFSLLRLTMLGYATVDMSRAPARLGAAFGLHAVAPAVMLVAGASLLGPLGPRGVFTGLAAFTMLALPLALALPREARVASPAAGTAPAHAAPPERGPEHPRGTERPRGTAGTRSALAATTAVAFATDGLVPAGAVLALIASGVPLAQAATLGGLVLASRKVLQVVVAPVAGRAAQRRGLTPVVGLGMVLTVAGLGAMAAGAIVAGGVLAVAAAAGVLTMTPAALAAETTEQRMRALGWITTARDVGAATGAAFAPLLLAGERAAAQLPVAFAAAALLVVVATVLWLGEAAARRPRD